MSNRRDLKKVINSSFELLYIDCILYTVTSKEPKIEKLDSILADIQKTENDLLSRISNSEGKEIRSRTKAYYNKIKTDLKNEIDRIGKEIQTLD